MTRSLEVSNYWHENTCQCEACKAVGAFGQADAVGAFGQTALQITNSVNIDTLLQQGLKRLYDRKIAAGSTDAAFVKYNQEQLFEAVKSGWQGKVEKLKYGSPQHELLLNLRHNTRVFSIFKVHDMCNEVHAALFDENGNQRTFAEFKKAAGPILKDYNANWLQAEYQTAQSSARMAQKWKSIGEQYGNDVMLTYKTIGDGRVRDEHALLDGTTRPKTDSFWDTYYPPNGFRCRCYVRASPGGTLKEPAGLPEVPKLFRANVGKLMVALPPDHPYYQVPQDQAGQILQAINIFTKAIGKTRMAENFRLAGPLMQDQSVRFLPKLESGGFVAIHQGTNQELLKIHTKAAQILAGEGNAVQILPKGNYNLDINGIASNLRTATEAGKHTVANLLGRNVDMLLDTAVLDLSVYPTLRQAVRALVRGIAANPDIKDCWLIYGKLTMEVIREQALSGKLLEMANKKALGQ